MGDETKVPRLRVLEGGQSIGADKDRITVRPIQLGLPVVRQQQARVVSIGWDGLAFERFVEILLSHTPSRVVDIRVSPSFQTNGFSRDKAFALLDKLGVVYVHEPTLANTFVGEHWNPAVALDLFSRQILTHDGELKKLREWVSAGPVVLLGRSRAHAPSERSVVVDALARLDRDFTLVIEDR